MYQCTEGKKSTEVDKSGELTNTFCKKWKELMNSLGMFNTFTQKQRDKNNKTFYCAKYLKLKALLSKTPAIKRDSDI